MSLEVGEQIGMAVPVEADLETQAHAHPGEAGQRRYLPAVAGRIEVAEPRVHRVYVEVIGETDLLDSRLPGCQAAAGEAGLAVYAEAGVNMVIDPDRRHLKSESCAWGPPAPSPVRGRR